ncbi:MAG TPA: excinuclease ABC subunit UvrC [Candidatus Competibacteraceae bacterium]|nr:excinuclease ABC subunit UvrC [Candidatus Competibacteraceae bacterium]
MSQSDTAAFDPKAFLQTLTTLPGVYRMLDARGEVLYVGKARNLKRRVASYFRANPSSAKTRSLVAHIRAIEVTVTRTEGEALLLENNLIKQHQPRYNVLLRDDKGYPYIHLSAGPFPKLSLHRGAKRAPGRYFGPYPAATAVRETLQLLQKVFRLRPCEDSFFNNRSRPCLQYQIKRCSGACTGMISAEDYRRDVRDAELFLEGKSGEVIDQMVMRMEAAAAALRYEEAARYRDQIMQLRQIQQRQYVDGEQGDLDVVAAEVRGGAACVQVFFFRGGRLLGNKAYFPRLPEEEDGAAAVLTAFLTQFYLEREVPREIIVSQELLEAELLAEVLGSHAGHKVVISSRVRGERARWLEMARRNAEHALTAQLLSRGGMRRRFQALQDAFALDYELSRLECFDISHTLGEATVASCVVFNGEGPLKSDYRRYNIEGVAPGDDYGAMRQALTRRFAKHQEGEGVLPDILFIDGGKGQLAQAEAVFAELDIHEVRLVAVAKGAERRAGLEQLYLSGQDHPLILPKDSAALHLIQQIRDEAHRFAITGHRLRRGKQRTTSILESIPGVGAKRRQSLLKQFGGLQQLARAGVEDIARVDGINKELAQRIYDAFHGEN